MKNKHNRTAEESFGVFAMRWSLEYLRNLDAFAGRLIEYKNLNEFQNKDSQDILRIVISRELQNIMKLLSAPNADSLIDRYFPNQKVFVEKAREIEFQIKKYQ